MESRSGSDYFRRIQEAAVAVKAALGTANTAIVLGSGLGNFTTHLTNRKELSFHDVPYMPMTTVPGHSGRLVTGEVAGKRIFCVAGRTHAYEGFAMHQLTFCVRVLYYVGCRVLIATNASGGCLADKHYPGAIVVLKDHINFHMRSPVEDTYEDPRLVSPNFKMEYSERLAKIAYEAAASEKIDLSDGVYGWTTGPTFETPTEVQCFRTMGASVVGMSTVPEMIAARALGMEAFAMALVTNLAAGMSGSQLTHDEVQSEAASAGPRFERLLKAMLTRMDDTVPAPTAQVAPAETPLAVDYPLPKADLRAPFSITAPSLGHYQLAAKHIAMEVMGSLKALHLVLFVPRIDDMFLRRLRVEDVKTGALAKIPFLPQATPTARKGVVRIGKVIKSHATYAEDPSAKKDEFNVMIIANESYEGLSSAETLLLVGAARLLGAQNVLQLIDVVDMGELYPYIMRVSDVLRFTTDEPIVPTAFPKGFEEAVGEYSYPEFPSMPGMSARVAVFPGPLPPTKTEVAIAKSAGCQAWTVHRTFIKEAAAMFAMCGEVLGNVDNVELDSYFAAVEDYIEEYNSDFFVLTDLSKPGPWPEVDSLAFSDDEDAGSFTDSDDECRPLPARTAALVDLQCVEKHVEAAAAYLRLQLRKYLSRTSLVVLVGPRLAEAAKAKLPRSHATIPFASIPFMPRVTAGEVRVVRTNGEDKRAIIYVLGVPEQKDCSNLAETAFIIRALSLVTHVPQISVAELCSLGSNLAVGSLVCVSDHVNFSGLNNLFGANHNSWGVRFQDMSHAYDEGVRTAVIAAAEKNVTVPFAPRGTFGFVGGRETNTNDLLANLARAAGVDAISTGVAPQVITARHMQVPIGVVGIVTGVPAADALTTMTPNLISDEEVERLASEAIALIQATGATIPLARESAAA